MADFQFLENSITGKWVVSAPRRAKRPDIAKGSEPVCPFCIGREKDEQEVYRVPSRDKENSQNDITSWQVRVLNNKFPFAPIHEVIIHSPSHYKNFDELPIEQIELILQTYKNRYLAHKNKGQVYIFHNRGEKGGESLPHPHTQVAVVPNNVKMDVPRLDSSAMSSSCPKPMVNNCHSELDSESIISTQIDPDFHRDDKREGIDTIQTEHFYLFCPLTSQWPDEVWIAPITRGRAFGEITEDEIKDLASILSRLIKIFDIRHGNEFPFNFYIYPGGDWYLRIIPRIKTMGGFELGTGVLINTQDPKETIAFIKEHLVNPDHEKIKQQHQAEYGKSV